MLVVATLALPGASDYVCDGQEGWSGTHRNLGESSSRDSREVIHCFSAHRKKLWRCLGPVGSGDVGG